MKVLVACEESQEVTKAFRAKGHEAYSCDILDCSGGHPEWHLKGDIKRYLFHGWDLMIAHPPCTFLTNSAAWAFTDGPYHQKVKPDTLVGEKRRTAREESLRFVCDLLNAPIDKICIENPIGAISSRIFWYIGGENGYPGYRVFPGKTIGCIKPQIIQPYNFGDDASKSTGLYLKNLLPLYRTKYIEPRIIEGKKRWGNQTDSGQNRLSPSEDRAKERSKTYPGIAKAMADQWG